MSPSPVLAAAPAAPSTPTTPADARCAASLILVRDGAAGLELLMLQRAEREADLRSGLAVFPGGVLDARDRAAHACVRGGDDAGFSARLGLAEGGLDYAVAALRETFEEAGLLLARRADGSWLDDAALQSLAPWRDRLQHGEAGLAALCQAHGLTLDVADLHYSAHWLTPPGPFKRFDTRFFIAPAPTGQVARADLGEALALMWLTPAEALSPQRGLKLLPVTRQLLQALQPCQTVAAALAQARQREQGPGIARIMPRRAQRRGQPCVLMPQDRAYAEVGRIDPEGRGDASAELVPGVPVRLSSRVWRVTAPNPGPMTGPGTNSYLVGDGAGLTVIDPGPAIDTHVQALLAAAQAVGQRIERILVTHTHLDHSPAARLLAAATGAPVWGRVVEGCVVEGRDRAPGTAAQAESAAHAKGQDASFSPSHQPEDGERVRAGSHTHLRALATPGHASNHLCWWLEEESLLFTGDHVMQGSTVVINPPDGDMAAYLRSLQALRAAPPQWLAPGHGFLVDDVPAVLDALVAHRLRREARVRAALRPHPQSLAVLVKRVYDDVDAALHPVAERSLLAHLLKLEAEGLARLRDGGWVALD